MTDEGEFLNGKMSNKTICCDDADFDEKPL